MSSRISIWGKAVAGHPVKRENNRPSSKTAPAAVKQPPPPPPPEPEVEEFKKPASAADQTSVYNTPDAWDRKFKPYREARPYVPSEFPPGRPRMKKEQRRRNTLSIAISEVEENLIRQAAAERGLSISDWARRAFFRYMGRKPPTRDTRRADWSKGPEILKEDDE